MTTPDEKVKPIEEEISDKLPCPEGDIFSLPTKAEIINAFNEIAALPGKLFGKLNEMRAEREKEIAELYKRLEEEDLTEEERDEILKQIEEKENFIATQIEGKLKEEVEDVVKTIEEFEETISDALSPFWKDKEGQNRDWQAEARDAFTEVLQDFHTYIPTKIAEIISKIVPFEFKINLLGLEIDILKLATSPAYGKEIKSQIAGKNFVTQIVSKQKQLKEINEKIKKGLEDGSLSTEEIDKLEEDATKLREEIDELHKKKSEWVDKFFQLIPEEFRQFDGEFGVLDDEAKAKLTWKYIKTEIKEWIQNWYIKAIQKVIGIFQKIWKLLGLPSLPIGKLIDIMNLDIGALIREKIQEIKDKWKETKLGKQQSIRKLSKEIEEIKEKMENPDITMEEHIKLSEELDKKHAEKEKLEKELKDAAEEFHKKVHEKISELNIFGFDIKKIIGGEIESTTESIEELIADISLELKDFKANWHKKIMFEWVKIVKKFFSAIGLGKIFEILFLTWCDFLKLLGMPTNIGLKGLGIAGIATITSKAFEDDPRQTPDQGDDSGILFANGDGVKTEFDLPDGSGTARIFIDGKEDEMIMEDGSNLLLESVENVNSLGELPDTILLESTQGATIVGNKIIFDTAPTNGTNVSIIKI